MRIFDLAVKDLSQILRDKLSFLFLLIMPVGFTFFMGLAYRGGGSETVTDTRLVLAYVDPAPEGAVHQALLDSLENSGTVHPILMEEFAAREALEAGEVMGILLVPQILGIPDAAGDLEQVQFIAHLVSTETQSLYHAVRVQLTQLMSAVEISQIGAEANPTLDPTTEREAAFSLAWEKWQAAASEKPVRVEKAAVQEPGDPFGGNPYNQASPGILVQFAIFSLVTSAQILVQERKTRTLQRLKTTAMRPWEQVAGHLMAMFVLVLGQILVLVLVGQLFLGVNYLRVPLGTLLVGMALGLWVATVGLLIGTLAKGDEQVILFSLITMFLFSSLGGVWFPLEVASGAFVTIGKLTPSAWAMTGFQNILIRGLGLESAWLPTGIILLYALGFFLVAVWRFSKIED